MYQRFIYLTILTLLGLHAAVSNAQYVTVNGIKYYVSEKDGSAEVYYDQQFTGSDLVIEETVAYGGKVYPVTSIKDAAFKDCTTISTVKLPDNLELIGDRAFKGCTGLTSIVIPNKVTKIVNYAFWNCKNLTSAVLGESLTDIGDRIFDDCTNLKEVWLKTVTPPTFYKYPDYGLMPNLPATVYVPKGSLQAYKDAIGWKSNNLEEYEPHTFKKEVTFNGLNYIYDDASKTYILIRQSENPEENYVGLGEIIIPSNIIVMGTPYPVSRIADNALLGSSVTSVKINNGITEIGVNAFKGCAHLTTIELPSSMISIKDGAFAGCPLASITSEATIPPVLGSGVFDTDIYESAKLLVKDGSEEAYKTAEGWKNFFILTYETYDVKIGEFFWHLNTQTKSAQLIPQSNDPNANYNQIFGAESKYLEIPTEVTYKNLTFKVTEIADNAFNGSSLLFLKITDPNLIIGTNALANCAIKGIDVPSLDYYLTNFTADNFLFADKQATLKIAGEEMTVLNWPADKPVVPELAFSNIISLESVIFEDSQVEIQNRAFQGCKYLNNIKFPATKTTTILDNAFAQCTSLKSLTITPAMRYTSLSFSGCSNVTTLTISDGITDVTDSFNDLINVRALYLGKDVKSLGSSAFAKMTDLRTITFNGLTAPSASATTFSSDAYKYTTVNIHAFAVRSFSESTGWNQFKKLSYDSFELDAYPGLKFELKINSESKYKYSLQASAANKTVSGSLAIPEYIESEGYNYYIFDLGSFKDCSNLKTLTLPNNVMTWDGSLSGAGITRINIPEISVWLLGKFYYGSVFNELPEAALYVGAPGSEILLTRLEKIPQGIESIPYSAFEGYSKLEYVSIPTSITTIGNSAFSSTSLKTLRFEDGNKSISIGTNAFSNTPISGLYIGRPIQDSGIFKNIATLKSVAFGQYFSDITASLFSRCTSLEKIDLTNIKTVNNEAFMGCSSLKEITFPECVNIVGTKAFADCASLSSVTIEKSSGYQTTTFHSNVFQNCPLSSVYYGRPIANAGSSYDNTPWKGTATPFDLTVASSVPSHGFTGSAIKSLTFEKGTTEISGYSFDNCTELESIVIPASITTIGNAAFQNTPISYLEFEDSRDEIKIGSYAFRDCKFENLYLGRDVSGSLTFSDNLNLRSVELGRYITEIGNQQFSRCYNLNSFTVGAGVNKISATAFSYTHPQKVIWLPNTRPQGYEYLKGDVNYVSQASYDLENQKLYRNLSSKFWVDGVLYVFNREAADRTCVAIDCRYFKSVENTEVPNVVNYRNIDFTVEEINEYTFYANTYIKTAKIGNNISHIGKYAFFGNTELQSIFIPNSVKTIGEWGFANCLKMESVILGKGLTEIKEGCFSGDSKLTEIMIPANVTTIGNKVFDGCKGLKYLQIMDRSTELHLGYSLKFEDTGDNPRPGTPLFNDCPLEEVYIGGNISYSTLVEDGYSPFYGNTHLIKVSVHDNETEISDYEFYGCSSLTDVVIGNGVERIGDFSFSGCRDLANFSFGTKVKYIGEDAFSDCVNMVNLTSKNTVPPTCGPQALDDINKFDCTLFVPAASIVSYQNADQWRNFFNISPIQSVAVPVTSISLNAATLTLNVGEQETLNATVSPDNATLPTLRWESDNTDVAMVSQFGNILAIGTGSCYITASSTDGTNRSATCFVTVDDNSGVLDVSVSDIMVIREGSIIRITGASDSDRVRVFNANAAVVYDGYDKTIEGLGKGLHIIVVANKTFKVLI